MLTGVAAEATLTARWAREIAQEHGFCSTEKEVKFGDRMIFGELPARLAQ